MEQIAAIKAKVHHVLPVSKEGKTYSIETLADGPSQTHEVVCKTAENKEIWRTKIYELNFEAMLETDVQEVYVIDLNVKDKKIAIKLEYREPVFVDATNGKLLNK